ncbi:CAP domain-containing protein [Leptospira sp. GIMC2001]|uniref:CAP domain-containing protein n=1 Tax=Leptospira sp. GIMC2001 TaxID=1513297 RepID=UPI002348FAE8|nr:CAP domain-containing protein [Leptospira sp. GIMC2001]WCL48760.1 CAP domain-containing protein [Leptospira sp. GIMC2001]
MLRLITIMNSKNLVLALLVLFLFACRTTQPDQPKKEASPQAVDSTAKALDIEVLEMPFSSKWDSNKYKKYNSDDFRKFSPFNDKIDFKKIDYPLLHAAVFFETNKRRVEMDLPDFEYSQALEQVSVEHSRDMVRLDFSSHNSPVPGRETPKKRMEAYGITNAYTAENINIGYGVAYEGGRPVFTPDQNKGGYFSYDLNGVPLPAQTYLSLARSVVDSWMNSPGHRRNILNTNLKYLGVGSAYFKDSKFYNMDKFKFTQSFSSAPGLAKQK